jgi:hypothetical protein
MKIFNIKQANIFIQNGATPIGCGLGNRDKVYIEFQDNKILENLMTRWMVKEF